MTRVLVDRLCLQFPVYHSENRTLKRSMAQAVANHTRQGAGSALVEDARHRVTVDVLREISFTLGKGERLGLIGGNGAGKTTLLRALAGIYEPVSGRVRITGSIGTLLDTQLGMNMELTGLENVRLRCLSHGLGRVATARFCKTSWNLPNWAIFCHCRSRLIAAACWCASLSGWPQP
ncbi:ATP-binding cassette domain-containing protein [Asaia platycodi]|uniref:ATP-binding cassette domain-containing protein n=1 Tax=Asaia platycodi TaxID=610243 RepID=UPI001F59610A|nr:ATP-binding cassette domain-containing protein [Asaia platycodi]